MKFGLTLAVILAVSIAAQAAITVEVVNKGTPTGYAAPMTKYWVILKAGAGDKVSGFDGSFDKLAGSGMVQQWSAAGDGYTAQSETSWASSVGLSGQTTNVKGADSRILVAAGNMLVVKTPWEDNSAGTAGGQGFGNKLAGAYTHLVDSDGDEIPDMPVFDAWTTMSFGIKAANQVENVLLAQIILANPATDGVVMTGAATAAQGSIAGFQQLIGAPEPATMGLIAIGALALIRRRR